MNMPGPSVWYWLASGLGTGTSAVGAYVLARWSPRGFLAGISSLSAAAYLLIVPSRYPPRRLLDPDVPPVFLDYFWHWLLPFGLGVLLSLLVVVGVLRSARRARGGAATAELAKQLPDLAHAWREVEVRLGQERIDPGARRAVVILAPGED